MEPVGARGVVAALVALSLVAPTVAGAALAGPAATAGPGGKAAVPAPDGALGVSAPDDRQVVRAGDRLSAPAESTSASVGDSGGSASAVGTDDVFDPVSTEIAVTQRLSLTPDEAGSIGVTLRFDVPDRVSSLETTLPDGAAAVESTGFAGSGDGAREWDGETARPTVSYTVRVNETRDLVGPEGAPGEHLFVDAGEWALFRRPAVRTSWSWQGAEPVGISQRATTDGPGAVGEWLVYAGSHETHERRAHGQRFELVVPDRASLAESPESILDSLGSASDQLRVGDRDDEVFVLAAPTTSVAWGVRGLALGAADVWVRDEERLDTSENVWLHEYVHSRQGYETTPTARWTTEAMATYYGNLLALEQDRAEFDEFRDVLRRGTLPPQSGAVLTEPDTWSNAANYWKGGLVAADVDRRIRLATDGERSLQAAFSRWNARREAVDGAAVRDAVGEFGGGSVRQAVETYAATRQAPDLWTRPAHDDAFGATPARVSVGFVDGPDALAASGPYRNGTLRGSPLAVYEGETVTATGVVRNTGGAPAEYEARFAVDDRVVDSESGSIRPGATATHSFSHAFDSAGEHALAVGSDEVTVEAFEPATANVTSLGANRTELSGPGAVEFTATVTNSHGVPARGTVVLRGPDGPIIDREVPLGPGGERTVSGTARLDPGEYEFSVGEAGPLVVTVGNGGSGGVFDGSSGTGPGLGVPVAILALLAGSALAVRRSRRDR